MTRGDKTFNQGGMVSCTVFTITYKDLQATSGSGAKSLDLLYNPQTDTTTKFSIPAFGRLLGTALDCTVAFAGGSLSALTLSIGKSGGSATAILAAKDVFTAAAFFDGAAVLMAQNTAYPLNVTFTPTGDNCSAATAGSVNVYVYWLNFTTP